MSETIEKKAPVLRKELLNLIPILSLIATTSCLKPPDVQADPTKGPPPAEQLVDGIESSLTQFEKDTVFDLAANFGSVLLGESLPTLGQIGVQNPALEFMLIQTPEGEWEPLVFTAGDNHYDFVSIYDGDQPIGILLRNLDIPDNSHRRATDVVRMFQSRDKSSDLKGISEEGDTVLTLDSGWIDNEINPEATIEVMTVDKNLQEAGFYPLNAEPSEERFTRIRVDTVKNPENEKELVLQPTETASQKTSEGSVKLISFIPSTPEGLVPTETAPGETVIETKAVEEPASIPTEISIPILEGLSIPVPDPRVTNPELFDLAKPESPIPQLVTGLQMAGIETTATEISQNITFQTGKNKDGESFVIAVYNTNPDNSVERETLEGDIPLAIATKSEESGQWTWSAELRDTFDQLSPFTIGALVLGRLMNNVGQRYIDVAKNTFNGQTISYNYSWEGNSPQGKINFQPSDRLISFAKENNTDPIVIQHLVWWYYVPDWLKQGNYSREEIEGYMVDHINEIMTEYRDEGLIYVVVNEANTPKRDWWAGKLGRDYYIKAFETARSADPDATLLYSDYGNETSRGPKTAESLRIVRDLKERDLVDGIGLHYRIDAASPPQKEDLIKTMQAYGVPVYISELDVDLSRISYLSSEEKYSRQAEIYAMIYRAAVESGVCKGLYIYGIGDQYSWLETDRGKVDADATLFDDDLNAKPALYAILQELIKKQDSQ